MALPTTPLKPLGAVVRRKSVPTGANHRGIVGAWIADHTPRGLNWVDLSEEGNDGLMNGITTANWTGHRLPGLSRAVDFPDVSNNEFRCGTDASLEVQAHTISVWMNPDDVAGTQVFASKSDAISSSGVEWALSNSGAGRLGLAYNNGSIRGWYLSNSGLVVAGEWHFYTISFTGSSVAFYRDGIFDSSTATNATAISYSSDIFRIGNQPDNNGLDGKLACCIVENYARDRGEVQGLYQDAIRGFPRLLGHRKKITIGQSLQTVQPHTAGAVVRRKSDQRPEINQASPLARGLAGAWIAPASPHGKTWRDLSNRKNHGDLSQPSSSWLPGSPSSNNHWALAFNDSLSHNVDLGVDLNLTGELSCCIVFNPEVVSSAGSDIMFGNADGVGANADFIFEINRTNGRMSALRSSAAVTVTGNNSLSANTWYCGMVTISGSTGSWTGSIYQDGVLDNTGADTNNAAANGETYRIGRAGSFNDRYFEGQIHAVLVWDRALSAEEAMQVYQEYRSGWKTLLKWPKQVSAFAPRVSQPRTVGAVVRRERKYPNQTQYAQSAVWWLKNRSPKGTMFFDVSGNSRDGTLNSVGPSAWNQGPIVGPFGGKGFDTDGITDSIRCDNCFNGVSYPFSLSCWLRMDDSHVGGVLGIGDGTDSDEGSYILVLNGDITALSQGVTTNKQASYTANVGQWYHAVAVFHSQTNREIYVDGVLRDANTEDPGTTNVANYHSFWAGVRQNNPSPVQYFDGQFDDCRLFLKGLSAGEVRGLYRASLAGYPSEFTHKKTIGFSPPPTHSGMLAAPVRKGSSQITPASQIDWGA